MKNILAALSKTSKFRFVVCLKFGIVFDLGPIKQKNHNSKLNAIGLCPIIAHYCAIQSVKKHAGFLKYVYPEFGKNFLALIYEGYYLYFELKKKYKLFFVEIGLHCVSKYSPLRLIDFCMHGNQFS